MDLSPHEEGSTKRDHDLGSLASRVTGPRAVFQTPTCMPQTLGASGPLEVNYNAFCHRISQQSESGIPASRNSCCCAMVLQTLVSVIITQAYRGTLVPPSYTLPSLSERCKSRASALTALVSQDPSQSVLTRRQTRTDMHLDPGSFCHPPTTRNTPGSG